MRVNIYAEEMSQDVEIIQKGEFTGVRFYLYLPVTQKVQPYGAPVQVAGKFMHHPGDDDSSAVTFWGKRDLEKVLMKALELLQNHHNHGEAVEHLE